MFRKFKTGLAACALAAGLMFPPAFAQEYTIKDGYMPLDHCFPKEAGIEISHYLLRGYRVGFPEDNFYGIMIPVENVDTPGLAISGVEPGALYKLFISPCDKEGNCKEDGFIVRGARKRKEPATASE